MDTGNPYHKIEKTEWDFYLDTSHSEKKKIKLCTLPAMTAKLKWHLNKYYKPAFEKQMFKKLNNKQIIDLLASNGVKLQDIAGTTDKAAQEEVLSGIMPMILDLMQNEPLEELHSDFDKAVGFCLLCIDTQRILQQEGGREKLDMVLDKSNWEYQKPELLEGIINQYSFRNNEVASLPEPRNE